MILFIYLFIILCNSSNIPCISWAFGQLFCAMYGFGATGH